MNKKILTALLMFGALSYADIREYRPDFEKIDKYKSFKQAAGYLQEFNYITPSYSYLYNGTNSNTVGLKWGAISYQYNNELKHSLKIGKDISEILNTGVILKYHSKVKEFYDLKNKRIKDYKDIINAYYSYLGTKIELENSLKSLENNEKNIKVANLKYELGKISEYDHKSITLKYEYNKLNVEKLKMELKTKEQNLIIYGIDKSKINNDDINIYKIKRTNLQKYVSYQNEVINNAKNIRYYNNLKNKIDIYMPNINLEYSYNSNNKEANGQGNEQKNKLSHHQFGFSISKSISLADRKYIDNKISKDRTKILNLKYEDELDKYSLMLKTLKIQEQKYELVKKELEIAKLNLDLGKLNILSYIEKTEKEANEKLELIKKKIELSKYVLERE